MWTRSLTPLSKLPLSQSLSYPTVFADFQAAFLQQHVSILRNMIVYTLWFLEMLGSASVVLFALQLGNQATELNIDIPIYGLISIFIKCGMYRFFTQRVTNSDINWSYSSTIGD